MSRHLHVTDDLAAVAGPLVAAAIADRVDTTGRCVLGLSGGSTPGPTLAWLAEHLDARLHDALTVTFVDERHLPLTGNDWADLPEASNARLAWSAWFRHRMPRVLSWARRGPLDDVRATLDAELRALGGIDVALLGAGPDGHTASLFPGRDLAGDATVVAVRDSPKPPPERLSLSAAALQRVHTSVLLARGADKADVLARAWRSDPTLPLSHATPTGPWHWVLDPAAATQLQESP